jgi:ketosteroid isomerase-like protein
MNKPSSLGALLKSNDDPADSPEARRAAKNAILAFFRAVATKDTVALGQSLTDDAVYEIPFSESGSTEPGQFRRYVGAAAINADGSRVFIEQRGNMVLSDGRSYRNRYVFRFAIRNGRICHVREYFNPVTAAYAFKRKIANSFTVETL